VAVPLRSIGLMAVIAGAHWDPVISLHVQMCPRSPSLLGRMLSAAVAGSVLTVHAFTGSVQSSDMAHDTTIKVALVSHHVI